MSTTLQVLSQLQPDTLAHLAWVGKDPRWVQYRGWVTPEGLPATEMKADVESLAKRPGAENHAHMIELLRRADRDHNLPLLAVMELISALVTGGPKLFEPTEEQWESMEQVELNIPVHEFTTPFPCMAIRIPLACRARLAAEHGVPINEAPREVIVRFRREPDENAIVVMHMGDPKVPEDRCAEVFYFFQDQEANPTIETALARDANRSVGETSRQDLMKFGHIAGRAAMNLCLLLTHFGCSVHRPPAKNRKERRAHQLHGDVAAVTMNQTVVVRMPSSPGINPPGGGTGIEVKPHWRRGHWRCYPGTAKRRALGEKVPLMFIRPCLVRSDRVVGDLSQSQTTYVSK